MKRLSRTAAVVSVLAAVALSAPFASAEWFENPRIVEHLELTEEQAEQIEQKTASLEKALSEVQTLRGLLPMCSHCRKVRDDEGLWSRLDKYLTDHSGTQFTHGLCPDCLRELYPEEADAILTRMESSEEPPDRM